ATAIPPLTDTERARWKSIADNGPPAGTTPAQLLPELEALLASPDPERRDRVAYEILAKWLMAVDAAATPATPANPPLDDATVAALRDRLVARLAIPASPSSAPTDAIFARSFAALGLSVVAAREAKHPVWTAATLDAQITAAAAYAAAETDLRGYTSATTGWAHAAAHTSDWLKFLARHPHLTAPQARRILDALTTLATRRHGARFSHGEDERMAAAARAVLRRGLLDDAAVDAWLRTVGEPLAAGWPDPFDPTLYAAQRNARDLLVSVYIALSFDDAAPAAAALARLRAFMMS
ncbi:MAG TPA: DUF2785 domain-containing protein, partial [Kofleriaceae bacterium]|nr:DUF2785 domain-containing protein [Kofleriaceae bacterium]